MVVRRVNVRALLHVSHTVSHLVRARVSIIDVVYVFTDDENEPADNVDTGRIVRTFVLNNPPIKELFENYDDEMLSYDIDLIESVKL